MFSKMNVIQSFVVLLLVLLNNGQLWAYQHPTAPPTTDPYTINTHPIDSPLTSFNAPLLTDTSQLDLNATFEVLEYWSIVLQKFVQNATDYVEQQIHNAHQDLGISKACERSMLGLLEALRRKDAWAYRMIDSVGRFPWNGIIDGSVTSFGEFDQCLDTGLPPTSQLHISPQSRQFLPKQITSQYCIVRAHLPMPKKPGRLAFTAPVIDTSRSTELYGMWTHVLSAFNAYYRLNGIRVGACIPDTCSPSDLETLLNHILQPQLKVGFTVDPECAQRDKPIVLNDHQRVAVNIFMTVFTLVALGTVIDLLYPSPSNTEEKNHSKPKSQSTNGTTGSSQPTVSDLVKRPPSKLIEAARCFSAVYNIKKLITIPKQEELDSNPLSSVHGWRVFNCFLIILDHVIGLATSRYPFMLRRASYIVSNIPHTNAYFFTYVILYQLESFFFLSGFTLSQCMLPTLTPKEIKQACDTNGTSNPASSTADCSANLDTSTVQKPEKKTSMRYPRFNFLIYAIHRWMRSLPSVIGITCLYFMLPILGNGPIYEHEMNIEANNCRETWWSNVLFIRNFWPLFGGCTQETWFLATDFQIYLLAPLVVIPLARKPKLGLAILWTFIAGSMIMTGLDSFKRDLIPTLTLDLAIDTDNIQYLFAHSLFPITRHIPPYFLGIFIGWLVFKARTKDGLASWAVLPSTLKTMISVAVASSVYIVVHIAYRWTKDPYHPPSKLSSAIYLAVYPFIWSWGTAWVSWLAATQQADLLKPFLSSRYLVPISRLTFGMYLTNMAIIKWRFASLRDLVDMNDPYTFAGTWIISSLMSLISAIILACTFEHPFINLEKLFLRSKPKPKDSSESSSTTKSKSVDSNQVSMQNGSPPSNSSSPSSVRDKSNLNGTSIRCANCQCHVFNEYNNNSYSDQAK